MGYYVIIPEIHGSILNNYVAFTDNIYLCKRYVELFNTNKLITFLIPPEECVDVDSKKALLNRIKKFSYNGITISNNNELWCLYNESFMNDLLPVTDKIYDIFSYKLYLG